MSGFQEILMIAVIVLAVIFLPRLRSNRPAAASIQQSGVQLTGRMRIAIAASVLYPAIIATFLKPWKGGLFCFLYIGLGPVVLVWLLYWVIDGFKKKNR